MLLILEILLLAALAALAYMALRRIYRFLFSPVEPEISTDAKTKFDHKARIDVAEDLASYGAIAALVAKAGVAIASPGAIGAALMWLGVANVPLLLTVGPIIFYFTAVAIAILAALKLYGKKVIREQESKASDQRKR